MPRFFLHIRQGNSRIEDFDGSDLPSLAAARAEALASARELLAETLRAGQIVNGRCFEIEDEHGSLLDIVMFRDAMRLPSGTV